MTRYQNCGAAVVLPTAPAWTFGHKRPGDPETAGPGAGKYPADANWNALSLRFGGLPGAQRGPWQISSAPISEGRHLHPDYLSQNPKGPAWTFGNRLDKAGPGGPGPGEYHNPGWPFKQGHSTWGPPPRSRPPSAPPRAPEPEYDRRKPKPRSALPGATFKGPHGPRPGPVSPGPAAYRACCGHKCCDMCDKYKGISFGLRRPPPKPTGYPGPNAYHVGCPTLGAAAAGCTDDGVCERGGTNSSYHAPTRHMHQPYPQPR